MDAVTTKLDTIKASVEQIIGNVKGGVVSPINAVNEIHELYENLIKGIRYPSESFK